MNKGDEAIYDFGKLNPVIQKFIQKQENALKAIIDVDHKPTYVQAYFACREIAKRALRN